MARGPAPTGRPRQRTGADRQPKVTVLPPFEAAEVDAPELPRMEGHVWNSMTLWWWEDVWTSPMAREYTEPDVHGLYRLAVIVDAFWTADKSITNRLSTIAEIRLQSQAFGLTPLDRSRLRWEVDRGEEADKKTRKRREDETPKAGPTGVVDPRSTLRA